MRDTSSRSEIRGLQENAKNYTPLAWKRRYDLTNYRIEPYQTARRTAEHIGPHRTTSDLN